MNEKIDELSTLMDDGNWNMQVMNYNLPQEIVQHGVTKIKIFERLELREKPWWMANSNGKFTTKSALGILRQIAK